MADQEQEQQQPQSNIRQEVNAAQAGIDMDASVSQIPKGKLSYALNAIVQNFDGNAVAYQNEPGNELFITFPTDFILIGNHFIPENNQHVFFLTNPNTGDCEIGYMLNNDGNYITYISAKCLNFNPQYPILKVVHKKTNCSTVIYWTDGYNYRRWLDLNSPPYLTTFTGNDCDVITSNEIDCNKLLVQPNFSIPILFVQEVVNGGTLTAGTYQFGIQYCDAKGNGYTSYYSITNPTPIFDENQITLNFNYNVGKSIVLSISNIDVTGDYLYYNIAVIKTINDIPSVELVGTYFIENSSTTITYTGTNQTQTRLTIQDVLEQFPFYGVANDITTADDVLIWSDLETEERISYQQIANKIELKWQTYQIPATENYSNEYNATNLRGYLRDEVYAFEIAFLLQNGKQTDSFHIPGRSISLIEEQLPDISEFNQDFVGTSTFVEGNVGYSTYWKIYNTASVTDYSPEYKAATNTTTYKGPYQYGEFAYWESTELYPCNTEIWGELSGQPIRHHKFPDVAISPIFDTPEGEDYSNLTIQNRTIYPIGVSIEADQVQAVINLSSLSTEQKNNIIGFKISRGDRGTNKSIVAKGLLRNVGTYSRITKDVNINNPTTYLFANYPYNDLSSDPFLLSQNNAFNAIASTYKIVGPTNASSSATIAYTDVFTNITTTIEVVHNTTIDLNSISTPTQVNYSTDGSMNATITIYKMDTYMLTSNSSTLFQYVDGKALNNSTYSSIEVTSQQPTYINVFTGTKPTYISGDTNNNISLISQYFTISSPLGNAVGYGYNTYCVPDNLSAFSTDISQYRYTFNSPETSFGQPFLGDILKVEGVYAGAGKAHFVQVEKNAQYKLLTAEAQKDALDACFSFGNGDIAAIFSAYQAYVTVYTNGITRKNYAYSYNSIASYDYCIPVQNNLGIKQRNLSLQQYVIPGVQSVGDIYDLNNYNRESLVYLKSDETNDALPFCSSSPSFINPNTGTPYVIEKSRTTISQLNTCANPSQEEAISVVSYYGSIKNENLNQWGQIYTYETIDTGYEYLFANPPLINTVFGGDTFISRFAFKTKLPFFIDNRVGAPDDSDIFYDEIGNIAFPQYWHSARSVLQPYYNGQYFNNLISYKAHNFDCPNIQIPNNNPASDPPIINPNRTYYDGKFYLFSYGIPSFYCESSINTDLRQAFNNREGDFYPHVSSGIPDEWVQESFVPIAQDNTYYYNVTYSKQNKETFFSHLPVNFSTLSCYTSFPFRTIYSDVQQSYIDNKTDSWLIYRPLSFFDFPQNYGRLISLDGIDNRGILARFENKTFLYNSLQTISTNFPQSAYVGNPALFSAPPVDYSETDLGYVGSQNKFLLKIPKSQITVDAKRGQIFLLNNNMYGQRLANDLTLYSSGVNSFMRANLPFQILKYFPNADVDNNYTGAGLHGVYDTKYNRFILTKLDYVPINPNIQYESSTKKYYIINYLGLKQYVSLTDTNYFCNKSFTISFNLTSNSWTCFHSYLPNFYIPENNFFYSGLAAGTDLISASAFELVATPTPTTTTTSSTSTTSTTTTTTTHTPYYEFKVYGSVGYDTKENACNATGDTYLILYSNSETLNTGSILYTDTALTRPYTGYSSWFKITDETSDTQAVLLLTTGHVETIFEC